MVTQLISWNDYVRLCLSYAELSENEDGSWTVEIPPLRGCVTWGESRAEALMMAEDAIHGWLVVALRFGDEIPVIDGCTLAYLQDIGVEAAAAYA